MIYNQSKYNENWDTKKLSDLGIFLRGKSKHRPRNDEKLFTNGKYPLVQTGDITKSNFYITKHLQQYNEFGLKQSKLWDKGTLCITIAANIAETAILSYPMCFPDSVVGFKAYPELSSEFFMHYVFSYIRSTIQKSISGSIQDNINLEYLENLKFKIPKKTYQDKIVSVLKTIDDKIENNNNINDELHKLLQSVFEYWLVQFDFPNTDDKPYKSSGGKMSYSSEFKSEIPEGWKIFTLGQLIVENDKSTIQVQDAKISSGVIPFFTSGDEVFYVFDKIVSGLNIYLSTGGNASIKVFHGDASYSTDTWCIHAQSATSFIYLYLSSMIKKINDNFFAGSSLKHLQKEQLKETYIYLPSDDLLNKFNSMTGPVYRIISKNMIENLELIKLRDYLLPMLINGQATVK